MSSVIDYHLTRFETDKRGNVAVVFGLMCTMIIISVGGAVEFSRLQLARSQVQTALDAAALAGARTMQVEQSVLSARNMATTVFDQNMAARSPVKNEKIDIDFSDNNSQLTATYTGFIPTVILGLAGIDRLQIKSMSQTTLALGGAGGSTLEVSLMLDVTSSMCPNDVGPCHSGPKMNALKAAARDLVNIVLPDGISANASRVALVPFSTRVRVGQDGEGAALMQKLTNLSATWSGWYHECTSSSGSSNGEAASTWVCNAYDDTYMNDWKVMPCVTDRFYDASNTMDLTDDVPGPGKWTNAHDGRRMPLSRDSSNTAATVELGVVATDPADLWSFNEYGSCSDADEANEIMPLTSDKTALNDRIDGLRAYGSTAGALGTAWSWYMLSPKWSSIWTGSATPAPYSELSQITASGAPKLRKVAVMLSDGVYNTIRGWNDQDQQDVSDDAKAICTNMKAQGIEIFTVGFALDQLPATERTIAEATLSSCGTDVDHFYNTLDAAQLQTAFRDIALQLAPLYVSK